MTEELWQYIGQELTHSSGLPGSEPVKEDPHTHMARMKVFYNKHPSWRIRASNPSSLVDEEKGMAIVFATSTISGFMVNLARERVHRSKWRRIGGQWKLVEHNVLIGGGMLTI
jgi:hypothetical protein